MGGVRARLTRPPGVCLPDDGALECADPASPDRCADGGDSTNAVSPPSPVSPASHPSPQQPTGSVYRSRSE